ncbi:MAG: PleD family two-component system response regulator, partial [Alphaproteobacteria bacterium]
MAKVLYIDERPAERGDMLLRLLAAGYEAVGAENGQSGLASAVRDRPDLVLCQSEMSGMSGLDVVRQLRDASKECEATLFILLSEEQNQDIREQ